MSAREESGDWQRAWVSWPPGVLPVEFGPEPVFDFGWGSEQREPILNELVRLEAKPEEKSQAFEMGLAVHSLGPGCPNRQEQSLSPDWQAGWFAGSARRYLAPPGTPAGKKPQAAAPGGRNLSSLIG